MFCLVIYCIDEVFICEDNLLSNCIIVVNSKDLVAGGHDLVQYKYLTVSFGWTKEAG
jgi:hypothetical protein